jgi:hypothetical protein
MYYNIKMDWIVFTYSLPARANTPRVTLWRRLRRLGAISPTGSVYILPANDECVEAFQWLAQEIRQGEGEVLVMHVQQFEGLDDGQIIALFNQAREEEYEEIAAQLADLERQIEAGDAAVDFQNTLHKLQKQHADVARVDYFQSPQGTAVAAQLNRISQQLAPDDTTPPQITTAVIAQYQNSRWVTRPRPHVDRLACAWLIRRYINPEASIRYAAEPEPDEVAFDMEGAAFSHQGNLCTFEVMIRSFELDEAALYLMAEIVHEIDLRDGRYQRPETVGIDATLRGWLLADMPDSDLEAHGLVLFDGLFAALSQIKGA